MKKYRLRLTTGTYGLNEQHKTVPALGALFHDPEIGCVRLHSKHREVLKGFAEGLMTFVDTERVKRGVGVWTRKANDAKPKSAIGNPVIQFTAPTQEAQPDAD